MTISLAGISALIIDDDVESLQILRTTLEQSGVRVMVAQSAEAARSMLDTITPDIIIMELLLPNENGLVFVRWLRSRAAHPDVPAIGVTSSLGHFSRDEVEAAGFTMLFPKPVNPMQLLVAVALLTHW